MVVHQVSQSNGAPQSSHTAARPAAAREAAAEQMQSLKVSSGKGVDSGEQVMQYLLGKGVSL